jgi:hypothetical protein
MAGRMYEWFISSCRLGGVVLKEPTFHVFI